MIKGRGEAMIVAVESPYMEFAGSLFHPQRQLWLRSSSGDYRVLRFEHVHVGNPSEAFGAFGMMASEAPEWLAAGVEVEVRDEGTAMAK